MERSRSAAEGFTLLEVMVALAILSAVVVVGLGEAEEDGLQGQVQVDVSERIAVNGFDGIEDVE